MSDRVRVHHQPAGEYVKVPNSFARSKLPASAVKVGVYLASHTEQFALTKRGIGTALGIRHETVSAGINALTAASHIVVMPILNGRGRRVGQVYHLSLLGFTEAEQMQIWAQGGEKTATAPATKSTHKKTSSLENHSLSRSTTSTEGPTYLPDTWCPNHTHEVMVRDQGLDMGEVLDHFLDAEVSREPRSDWDKTFGRFINAKADGSVWEVFA